MMLTRQEYKARCAYLKQENTRWGSTLEPVPQHLWPAIEPQPIAVLRSSHFLAQVFAPYAGGQRISVMRCLIDRNGDWMAGIGWEELMAVKRDCGFGDRWAVEIYPPDAHIVNVANMRHLWITQEPQFAWRK